MAKQGYAVLYGKSQPNWVQISYGAALFRPKMRSRSPRRSGQSVAFKIETRYDSGAEPNNPVSTAWQWVSAFEVREARGIKVILCGTFERDIPHRARLTGYKQEKNDESTIRVSGDGC